MLTGTLAPDGHFGRVSAECSDIVRQPFQPKTLVAQAEICRVFVGEVAAGEETKAAGPTDRVSDIFFELDACRDGSQGYGPVVDSSKDDGHAEIHRLADDRGAIVRACRAKLWNGSEQLVGRVDGSTADLEAATEDPKNDG